VVKISDCCLNTMKKARMSSNKKFNRFIIDRQVFRGLLVIKHSLAVELVQGYKVPMYSSPSSFKFGASLAFFKRGPKFAAEESFTFHWQKV